MTTGTEAGLAIMPKDIKRRRAAVRATDHLPEVILKRLTLRQTRNLRELCVIHTDADGAVGVLVPLEDYADMMAELTQLRQQAEAASI